MMNMSDIGYDLNEKDIDGVIRFLKTADAENATPETAINFLTYMKVNLRSSLAEISPDDLDNLYEQFKKDQPKD